MEVQTDTFEIKAGQLAAELVRRGIGPEEKLFVSRDPAAGFLLARAKIRENVEKAGLTDEDVDKLINETIKEVRDDMRRKKLIPPQ